MRCFAFWLLFCTASLGHSLGFPEEAASFSFERFERGASLDSAVELDGGAEVSGSSVRLKPSLGSRFCSVMYRRAINFGRRPSFSVELSFSISPDKGNGFALFVAPSNVVRRPLGGLVFGVYSGVFAVEFDTQMDPLLHDPNGNHVGVDVGSAVSLATGNASAIDVVLNSGEKLRSWVDFDGETKILEVRLGRADGVRPSDPLVSYPVDLSGVIWQEAMFVGVCSYGGGNYSQVVNVYSWSFRMRHAAPYLMHSEPLDPVQLEQAPKEPFEMRRRYYLPNVALALAIGAACGAALALLVVSLWSFKLERHPVAPVEYAVDPGEFECVEIVEVRAKGGRVEVRLRCLETKGGTVEVSDISVG